MIGFFLNILEITVGISLLVLIMLLVLKLFGGRFTAKCRYILWTLVLVRLAIPFSFNILPSIIEVPIQTDVIVNEEQNEVIDNPVEDQTPTTPPTEDHGGTTVIPGTTLTPGTTTPTNPGVTTTPTNPTIPANPSTPTPPDTPTDPVNPSVPSVDVDKPITNDPPQEEVIIPTPIPETPKEPLSVMDVLKIVSFVYIAGAVIFFLWNMLSYIIYTQRILRSARNADAKTIAIFLSICDKENLKKVPVLLVSPDINSPAAFGLISRKIVLPDITFTQNGLAGTLFHEVVHCKRGDLYIKVIELVARSLHWFNPLAHVSAFRCEMEMEMSCDETVLDGCNDDTRMAYGEVMLDIIRRCRRNKGALTTHFNPKKNSVKSRFANIINGSGSRRGKLLIPICLVLCIIAGTIVACTVGDDTPILKDYKINVIVDEELDGADGYNRDIHIIEVELDSEHEAEINETISAYFLDFYNEYMNSPGSAYDFPYQLIDTSYSVKNNILAITGVSRYSATSVPWSMVRSIFYDLENDKLCTVQEYFEATGLDIDKAEKQIDKTLQTHSQYEHLVWEISGVVYNEADELVLAVKVDNTNIDSEQIKYVYLIGYDFDKYCITNENRSFDGFDEMVWRDIPIVISAEYPSDEFLENYDESKIIDATSDEYAVCYVITSNVDVENTQITELIWNDSKLTDSVPLHKFDLKAGEPVVIMVSHPGAISNRALTYTDTFGVYRRFEITRSGEDGSPILIEITEDRLTEYFKASDLLAGEIEEYKLLIKDNNSEASLYYYYNGIESDFATKFRISADGHELDITTSLPAWLKNTWEPQIYRSNVTSDGGDRLFLIFTTGTGTGVHIEEAYVMNCFEGEIYAVPNPYDWVESVVSRGEDGKAWTVNSSGDKIELPDNAYFDQNFDFFVKNGKLYAKVLIGYGTWQYTEDYFLIEYGYNASGKIIAKSIKHSSEVDESFESTNLPRDFVNTYHTAEYFYAIFNGCARIEFYEETIEYEGEKYRNCSHVEFSNLAEMRNVIVRHFSDDITNSLMSKTVSGIGCPLYIEQDGKLYIFAGYAAQWGYSSATGYSFEPLGYENDEYLVRVSASINEYGVKYVAGDVCKYVIEADGSIRFTQFPLMIDLLWDAFAGEEEDVAPIPPVNVLSNPGGLEFKTIYIPYDRRYSTYDFDSEHILLMTYGTEQGERGHVTATKDIRFYLVNTVRGELVATLEYGRVDGWLIDAHHEKDSLVLYDLKIDEGTETYSVTSAVRIEYKNGKLSAQATEKDPWPRNEAMLVSPDGKYTVYDVSEDGVSHGGIDVVYPDGTVKRILTRVMLDDLGVYSVGGVTGYSPVQFIDNDRLLYHIGGWEWTKGYGIYNLTTGENTEFRNGYGAIGYADGYIYLREVNGYEPVAWYKATLDGNIQKIASVNEEENIFRLQDSRDIRFGGTSWRRTAGIYPSDYKNADGNAVVVKIYSLDINQQNNVLAEVRYDTTNCEILTISHGMTETAIVFAQEDVLPNVTKPTSNPVTVISNPKGYSVQTVYIPMSDGGRSSAYPYSDSQMLYMTFDLVTDAQGVTQAYSNIKLYLVDKERGRIVGECAIDGEYQLNNISYETSGNGIILRDVEFTHDRGYLVHGTFHILYSGGKLTATKVESAAYPQHDMPVIGNARDGVVYAYRTTDDGVGRGGIDLTMPDGTVKRILSNVVLDDAGGNLSNVMYYTPVGFIGATVDESAKLVYNIGAYEGAGKGFGIYDTATGEREEFLYMNYRAIDVWSNSIYFEEYKRTDEGYSESYRTWKRDRHGNMTLLWSLDPADGDAYHEGEPFPSFKNGLWYFDTYTDTEVPSYIKSNGYVITEIRHGDDFDPIVSVMYPHTVDRYSSNLLVTTSGRATVVLRVPESVIPPSVVTVEFSTIEELIEKFGNQIDAFAPGTYARQEFLDAVDKFINPAAHQDNMSKSEYSALSGMKLENISATYDSKSGKMYLTFTVAGEPVGTLKKGVNTAEVCGSMYEELGVMCGDTSENNANEARSAVSKYLHWIGFNGMPDSTWSGSYNFTDYMASCLNDIGKTPTRDAIVDYAERCFGISGYSPLNNQFDESGNHVQLGYGLSVTNFIITSDTVENGIYTVTVDHYRDSYYQEKYQTVNYRITKLQDGAWKFVEVVPGGENQIGKTYADIEFYTFIDGGEDFDISIDIPTYCYRYNGVYVEPKENANSDDDISRVVLSSYPHYLEEFDKRVQTRYTKEIKVNTPVTVEADNGSPIFGYYGDKETNGTTTRLYVFYLPTGHIGKAYALHLWQRLEFDGENYFDNVIVPIVKSVKFPENSKAISDVGTAIEIYERHDLKVRLPYFRYAEGTYLSAVSYINPDKLEENEIASFYQTYMMEEGLGHLYSIIRHTATEAFDSMSYEKAVEYFAYDDTYFYGILRPSDAQWDTRNESMRGEYEKLSRESDDVINLFIDANAGLTQCSHNEAVNKISDDKLVIQRQFNLNPEKYASEIAKMSGRVVTACGNTMGNSVYYYYPILLANDKQVTVYYTKDFGLSVYTTRAPLPEGIEFTYGKVVDAYHGFSGESIFVLRLENGDEVTFWYYMNFADEEVHEFELLGEITKENADRSGYTWDKLTEKTSDIPLEFEPSSYKTEIELQTGKEVLFWHKIFSNPVYLYFVPCDTGTLEFTVYVYKDYSSVTNRDGEGLSELKLHLPDIFKFGDVTRDIVTCIPLNPYGQAVAVVAESADSL